MSVRIDGSTGIDLVQDAVITTAKLANDSVTSAKIVNGAVTPADTQVGALPSMVRLNTANGYGSTNTMIRRFTNVVTNQGSDITYADSATLGASFTINTNGVYAISYTDSMSANSHIGISLNSNQLTTSITSITTTNVVADVLVSTGFAASCGATMYLSSGDVIRPHNGGVSTGSQTNSVQFVITRVA